MSLYAKLSAAVVKATMGMMNIPTQQIIEGKDSRVKAANYCKGKGYKRVMIMTDKPINKIGIPDKIKAALDDKNIEWTVFEDILPNPTLAMVSEAKEMGLKFGAQCVIAVGGGSVIDCAKLSTAAMTDPEKSLKKLNRLFTIKKQAVPLIAIPTTAGTGAEASVGAVISDNVTHAKGSAASPKMLPVLAILDGATMVNIPSKVTATTGFDALSHGVASYCSTMNRKGEDHTYGKRAVGMIMKALPAAYHNPDKVEYRNQMSKAAYLAGVALSREMAGYEHPLAHALGGVYELSHGELIACTLPQIMRFNKQVCSKQLAELAVISGLGQDSEDDNVLAQRFIDSVEAMRAEMNLSDTIPQLKKKDYPRILKLFFKDASRYPVPRFMNKKQAIKILNNLCIN